MQNLTWRTFHQCNLKLIVEFFYSFVILMIFLKVYIFRYFCFVLISSGLPIQHQISSEDEMILLSFYSCFPSSLYNERKVLFFVYCTPQRGHTINIYDTNIVWLVIHTTTKRNSMMRFFPFLFNFFLEHEWHFFVPISAFQNFKHNRSLKGELKWWWWRTTVSNAKH